jgi:hypothetical protein
MAANATKFLKMSANTSTTIWQRPEMRQLKLNVDASFFWIRLRGNWCNNSRLQRKFCGGYGKGIIACDDSYYGRGFGHEG